MQRVNEKNKKSKLPLLPSPSVYLFLTLHRLHVNFSHGSHLPKQSLISVCLPGWQNQWAVLGAGVDAAAEYKAGATWLKHTVTSVWAANLVVCFRFFYSEGLIGWRHTVHSSQRTSMSEQPSLFVCERVRKEKWEIKASPRGSLDHPSHWGKEPEAGRQDTKKEKKKKINKKREGERVGEKVELYIMAHCIIYKEARNNSRGCLSLSLSLSAMLPKRLKEMPQCTQTHTQAADWCHLIQLRSVHADLTHSRFTRSYVHQ